MSQQDAFSSKPYSQSHLDASASPSPSSSPSRRLKGSKRPKTRSGLTRAQSSLDITSSLEAFKPFEDSENAGNKTMETKSPSEVRSIRQSRRLSSSPYSPPVSRTPNDDDHAGAAGDHPLLSFNNERMTSEVLQEPSTPTRPRTKPHMAAENMSKEIMDDISSSQTFYGGIHTAYNTSCRELNALFGEINLEGLRSQTKREVCQVELLHLLAVSTYDPATYHGSIRRVAQICKSITNGPIAENLWKKTQHITYELDQDFEVNKQAPANLGRTQANPLSTIVEEDDDHPDHVQPDSRRLHYDQSKGKQSDLEQESLSGPHFSRNFAPSPKIKNDEASVASPSARLPVSPEENLAKNASDDYINMLHADALRRKEATDRYIANLEDDIATRKYATDQFIAELEAKARKMG
ncbi:hypothetical protein IWZ01DRAFT_485279 [Phyllosticta capitalensis]